MVELLIRPFSSFSTIFNYYSHQKTLIVLYSSCDIYYIFFDIYGDFIVSMEVVSSAPEVRTTHPSMEALKVIV